MMTVNDTKTNDIYVKFIRELADDIIGDDWVKVESNAEDTRIFISVRPDKKSGGYGVHTIWTDKGYFILEEKFRFNQLQMFIEYAKQVLLVKVRDMVMDIYVRGDIAALPSRMQDIALPSFKLSAVEFMWFKETFETIASEVGNSETVENIKVVQSNRKLTITFDVDCGRYGLHRKNKITVNERGNIQFDLCANLEGGDIQDRLQTAITEKIKE